MAKGEKRIVLHAGCASQAFLPGCDLVFRDKAKDNRDYHTEMNGKVFLEWVKNKLVPDFPAKSLINMDNVPYHSTQNPDSNAPMSNSLKGDLVTWLQRINMTFPSKATKQQLYEIIKSEPVYMVDNHIKVQGHAVLRLSHIHCDLNPMELMLGIAKGDDVGRLNTTFKLRGVEKLIMNHLAGSNGRHGNVALGTVENVRPRKRSLLY